MEINKVNIWDNLGKTVKLNSITDWPMNPWKARLLKMIIPSHKSKIYKQMTTIRTSDNTTKSMIEDLLRYTSA